ncbi:outer membrane protein [Hyphomicrobium facile]|uniref:Outer membrane immunogenic protein n=1 Tax=Hyphomicrobium facile TaxID=51670 RepID=A0A1I7MZ29_9HYPH|nr:outer membrane beta-barrel protein [Hyphomicrobium facile]SFV27618.1 outer membrane immunogenic protein [Hyphomicrobium facile]
MIRNRASFALVAAGTSIVAAGPAAANDWAGPYIGIGGGYGMTNTRTSNSFLTEFDEDPIAVKSMKDGQAGTGGFLTLSAGYDHALFGPLVVGAFVDYDFSDIDTHFSSLLPPDIGHFKIGDQLSVGGRVGYLVAPSTLFFSTFGYARSDPSDVSINFGSGPIRANLGSFNGYFLGSGVETLIGNGFSLKAEYRYTSMRAEEIALEDVLTERFKPKIQTIRMSLNYRFGDGKKDVVDNSIPPITSSWTGPYLGFGTGYSVANKQESFGADAGPFNNPVSNDGGFISASVGYDYQFRERFVVGAFADADFSNLSYNDSNFASDGVDSQELWSSHGGFKNILMVGGRLGYLTTPDTLLFVSGGYANAGMEQTTISILGEGSGVIYDSKRLSGAFIGAGVETKIWDSLSLKAEYRYIDLESEELPLFAMSGSLAARIDPDIQTGRLSVNWRP